MVDINRSIFTRRQGGWAGRDPTQTGPRWDGARVPGCGPYEQLYRQRVALLYQINPHGMSGNYCPEAADAVHDFLTTGQVEPVLVGAGVDYRMSNRLLQSFRRITFPQIRVRLRRNNSHIVVRGVRNAATQARENLTEHHYFVVARMHDRYYIVDAYSHEMTTDFGAYQRGAVFDWLEIPTVAYDVVAVDMLDQSQPGGPDL